jgi:hypothetical protein
VQDDQDLERAKELAAEAVALCDRLGQSIAAAHIQLGLDLIKRQTPHLLSLREERAPWESEKT